MGRGLYSGELSWVQKTQFEFTNGKFSKKNLYFAMFLFPILFQRKLVTFPLSSASVNAFFNYFPAFRAGVHDLEETEYKSSLTAVTARKLKVRKLDYANVVYCRVTTPGLCGIFKIRNVCCGFSPHQVPQAFIATLPPCFFTHVFEAYGFLIFNKWDIDLFCKMLQQVNFNWLFLKT